MTVDKRGYLRLIFCRISLSFLLVLAFSACSFIEGGSGSLAGSNKNRNGSEQQRVIDSLAEAEVYEELSDPELSKSLGDDEAVDTAADQPLASKDTVWVRIAAGLELESDPRNRRIAAHLGWFAKNHEYVYSVSERSRRYIYAVVDEAEKRQLPMELALLPFVESAYNPFAYSRSHAAGMWQFIPATGNLYGLETDWWYDGRRDVIASTQKAFDYLEKLNAIFGGDWLLTLTAYNYGEGNVKRAIAKNRAAGKPTDFWALDLPSQAYEYAPKLLALARLIDDPELYGVKLYPVPAQPYFAVVDARSQIDLAQAARMAGVDVNEIYLLNPAYKQWATSPQGPHHLLVPVASAERFTRNIAQLPATQRLKWDRYTIKSGDSLSSIARQHQTTVDALRRHNDLKGNVIRAGDTLVIPHAGADQSRYSLAADTRRSTLPTAQTGSKGNRQLSHQVAAGESLWSIAHRYNIKINDLCRWNGISPNKVLSPGQKLNVWVADSVAASTAAKHEPTVKKLHYVVRSGDSLAKIASKFRVAVSDITRWNSVNPNHYLKPGQQLLLYVDVTRG